MSSKLECLNSLELREILPVHDYIQLVFSGDTTLTVNNAYEFEGPVNPALETLKVIAASESAEQAVLSFSNGSRFVVGLKDEDYSYNCPEAMVLHRTGKSTVVWN